MQPEEIKRLIAEGMDCIEVHVEGDGRHFNAVIVSDAFIGKPMLEQHRMVYATLGDRMQSAIHALSMRTYNAEEWQNAQKLRPS